MGNSQPQIVVQQKKVYEKINELKNRSSKVIAEMKTQFRKQFGNEIQMKQDSKVITLGNDIKNQIGNEMNTNKSISWGKNFEGIQNQIANTIMTMKKYSNGTFSSCKGYFPVLGKFGVCIAAYGIYFQKIYAQAEGKTSQSQSISYVFGTYEYKPVGGWTKANIGMLVEACPINEEVKQSIYNSLVEKLISDSNQKQIKN